MIRIVRIALLVLVPTLALGALAVGCGDDTTTTTAIDMSVQHDLSTGGVTHDMASHD